MQVIEIIGGISKKMCCFCLEKKELKFFYKHKKRSTGYHSRCKVCQKLIYDKYRNNNPEKVKFFYSRYSKNNKLKIRSHAKNKFRKSKIDFFNAYGNKCACCLESNTEFLTMDHIEGGGTVHRALVGSHGVFIDARKEGYPKDKYRILCMNCNFATRYGNKCPHQKIQKD